MQRQQHVAERDEALLDAVTTLVPVLLRGLEGLRFAARHLHPPHLSQLATELETLQAPLAAGLELLQAAAWPAGLQPFREALETSAELTLRGLEGFGAAPVQDEAVMAAYRALGQQWRAEEALYPLAAVLAPVGRFFLNDEARADSALAARIAAADPSAAVTGLLHAANEPDQRGGFSLYVPEHVDREAPLPLIVALHGGSGHGRGFLWSWLKDARSAGALLVAPTAPAATWPLQDPEAVVARLHALIAEIAANWPVDLGRILLTGMSDGGTFTWLAGLRDDSPFTHLAPVAATFHPFLLGSASPARLANLPVYLVHGSLDWMFPVEVARMARDTLATAGAAVCYREIEDLSHTYPGEENARILTWLTTAGGTR